MRGICALLVIICCSLLGIGKAQRLRAHARDLTDLSVGLGMLQSEICRRRAPIAEVAETLSETAPGAAGRLFANLRVLLPMMDTLDFRLLWKRSVAALGLESDEVYALERLGLCLGRYEAEAQSNEIEACIRRISALETRAGERAASGGRLYTGLGVTLGLMTAVLIV